MAPSVAVPANLPDLVRATFVRARAAGDLTFFPTQVALLRVNGVPLRFAPSLAKKPKAAKTERAQGDDDKKAPPPKPYDPFEDPLPGLIAVPELGSGGSYRLILNKFAISQDHAILATTAFRPQSHLLDAADLGAAYACIEAYHRLGSEELFVFYNSGRHSGASQPHRHLQLLPVAQMREGMDDKDAAEWDVLADQLPDGGDPPFYVAAARLRNEDGDPAPSPEKLHAVYLDLYRQAYSAAKGTAATIEPDSDNYDVDAEEQGTIPARISYNLALTRRTMALLPRAAEGATDDGNILSLNGTVLAGTALVKSEAQWDALRSDPARLGGILAQIGVPASRGRSSAL